VHHSDRGSRYASNDYTDLLKAHGIDNQKRLHSALGYMPPARTRP
jgi:transposase InsO family protein